MKLKSRNVFKGISAVVSRSLIGLCAGLLSTTVSASGTYPTDSFSIPEGAYSAKFIADDNGVSVMSFSGNYDKQLEEGNFNRGARAEIAKEFYRTHPDNYDFLVVFSSFEFETGEAVAFYHGVLNDVQGIGIPLFDNSNLYGSNSKLQGMIDMASMSRYSFDPYSKKFDFPLSTLAHETLHRFGVFVKFDDGSGTPSEALLGQQNAHWSFFVDSDASVEYGNEWQDNGDGTYKAVSERHFYSDFDLYLMGLKRPEAVKPLFYINSDTTGYSKTDVNRKGSVISGTKVSVAIDQIVAVEGERIPNFDHSQKEFRFGFIYLVGENDQVKSSDIVKIDGLRKSFVQRFSILTGGNAVAHVYPEAMPVADLGKQTGIIVDSSDVLRVDGADIDEALIWLRAQQNPVDGHWADTASTQIRDTSIALRTLDDLDPSFNKSIMAQEWLNLQSPENTDSRSRVIIGRRTATASAIEKLLASAQANGGWGLTASFESNALDTALATLALNSVGHGSATDGAEFLLQSQNTDFAWSEKPGSSSSVSVTATVIDVLVQVGVADDSVLTNAGAWLAAQQNTDGGFGALQSSVHETALAVIAMVSSEQEETINLSAAVDYINSRQRVSGSWDGSIYTTAVAVRALRSVLRPNLAVKQFSADALGKRDGEHVVLKVQVRNDSPLVSGETELEVFDGDPSLGGVVIGAAQAIPTLDAGRELEFEFIWDTTDRTGSHSLFASIDPDGSLQERSVSDNLALLPYEVNPAPSMVDLVLSNSEFEITPQVISTIPEQISASVIVRNIGLANADNVTIQLWQSGVGSGKLLDTSAISLLGRSSSVVNFLVDVTQPGLSEFFVVVDPQSELTEADETNNVASKAISSVDTLDLEVTVNDIAVTPPTAILFEDTQILVTVRNKGTVFSPLFKLDMGVSAGAGFTLLNSSDLTLAPGEERSFEVKWRSAEVGESTFSAVLDSENLVAETDEDNNTAIRSITTQQVTGINLAVSYTDLVFNPNPAKEGLGVVLSARVYNTGTELINGIPVAFFDGDPTTIGTQIGAVAFIPELQPGESYNIEHIWPNVIGSQNRFIFVVVDPENEVAEFNEVDNKAFLELPVTALADLAISSSNIRYVPLAPKLGDNATFTATVLNLGSQAATNVVVQAFHGKPEDGGTPIGSGSIIDVINPSSSASVEFQFEFLDEGIEDIYVYVDPDSQVLDANRENNQALKRIAIQDGTFFVTERFISPDSNGIKDESSYFFNLDTPQSVSAVVLDFNQKEVRRFDESFEGIVSGSVTWDGRTNAGVIVDDGDYFFAVKLANGSYLGASKIEVDTNRLGLVYALDTPYEHSLNLDCRINTPPDMHKLFTEPFFGMQFYDPNFITLGSKFASTYSKDGKYIYYILRGLSGADSLDELDPDKVYTGLYRAERDGTNSIRLTDLHSISNSVLGFIMQLSISDDQRHIALLTSGSLWKISLDAEEILPHDISIIGVNDRDYPKGRFIPNTSTYILSSSRDGVSDSSRALKVIGWDFNQEQLETIDLLNLSFDTLGDVPNNWNGSNYTDMDIEFDFSPSGRYLALKATTRTMEYWEAYHSDMSVFFSAYSQLFILDTHTLEHSRLGVNPTAFAWSPSGDEIAVGDAANGGVSVYNLNWEEIQKFEFASQLNLESTYSYMVNTLPPLFREDGVLLGIYKGITWSASGLELAFAFEDYTKFFVVYRAGVEEGNTPDRYGLMAPANLDLSEFDLHEYHGIYVADTRDGVTTKVAEIQNSEQLLSTLIYNYVPENLGELSYSMNAFGVQVAPSGLPFLNWYGIYPSPQMGWVAGPPNPIHPDIARKELVWMPGSRALLFSGTASELSNDDAHGRRSSYILGLDKRIVSRRLFNYAGITLEGFPFLSNAGTQLDAITSDYADSCPFGDSAQKNQKQISSLLNLKTELQVSRSSASSGIILKGTAEDKNLDNWLLEYANIDAPDQWFSVMPPSSSAVVSDQFTIWLPPESGSYFVRLTATDLAGNTRQMIKRASIAEKPSISGLYRTPAYFSPNGDGVRDNTQLLFKPNVPINLNIVISDSDGNAVRTIGVSNSDINVEQSITWDGRDDRGLPVADGKYRIKILDYELYVSVDKETPKVVGQVGNLIAFNVANLVRSTLLTNALEHPVVYVDTDFGLTISDNHSINICELQYRSNSQSTWEVLDDELGDFVGKDITVSSEPTIEQWTDGEFRVHAEDLSGNRIDYIIPSEPKLNKVGIVSVGKALFNEDFSGGDEVSFKTGEISFESLFPELHGPQHKIPQLLLAKGEDLYLGAIQSLITPISKLELVYWDLKNSEELSLAPPTVIGSPVTCQGSITQCFSPNLSNNPEDITMRNLSLAWDIDSLGMEDGVQYGVHLRFTTSDGQVYESNQFNILKGFVAGIARSPTDGTIKVIGRPLDIDTVERIEIYAESNTDERYLSKTLIEYADSPNIVFARDKDDDKRITIMLPGDALSGCESYHLTAVYHFKNGDSYQTNGEFQLQCYDLTVSAQPELPENCGDPATERVLLTVGIGMFKGDRSIFVDSKELQVYTLVDGLRNTLFSQLSPGYGSTIGVHIETSDFEEGQLPLVVELTDVNGSSKIGEINIPIVHTPPSAEITYPLHEQTLCAQPYFSNKINQPAWGVEVQGQTQSANTHALYVVTNIDKPTCPSRFQKEIFGIDVCSGALFDADRAPVLIDEPVYNPYKNTSVDVGTLGIAKFLKSGEQNLSLRMANWSGALVCEDITVNIDAEIVDLNIKLAQGVKSGDYNDQITKKIKSLMVYSPNGDGVFDDINWTLTVGESVTVTVDLFEVVDLMTKADFNSAVFSTVISDIALPAGTHELVWDASTIPDGKYSARVTTIDSCGISAQEEFVFVIDNTAPILNLDSPNADTAFGVTVDPVGDAADANSFVYQLAFSQDGDSFNSIGVPKNSATFADKILGRWNTGGLTGDFALRFSATDIVGNTSVVDYAVSFPERSLLISSLESDVQYFSPNADGRIDSVRFALVFVENVLCNIRIRNSSGTVIRTLEVDGSHERGSATIKWDGMNSSGIAVEDGMYVFEIEARLAGGGGTLQAEQILVVADSTFPEISVPGLNQGKYGIFNLEAPIDLIGSVSDEHFTSYSVSVEEFPSGPSLLPLTSGELAPNILAVFDSLVFDDQGTYKLKVKGNDLAGNTSEYSFDVVLDTIAPVVTITQPVQNIVTKGKSQELEVRGNIVETNLANYGLAVYSSHNPDTLHIDQTFSATDIEGDLLARISLDQLPEESVSISLTAFDFGGLNDNKTVTFIIDNTAPNVAFRKPAENGYITGKVAIDGLVSDENIRDYSLSYASGETVASGSTFNELMRDGKTANGVLFQWENLPSDGAYILRLTARDEAGFETSVDRPVLIDTGPPTAPTIKALTLDRTTKTVKLSWIASNSTDTVGYHIYRRGVRINAETVNELTFTDADMREGVTEYAVLAIDQAGLRSEPSKRDIVIDFTPPRIDIQTPSTGDLVSGLVSIVGTAISEDDFKEYRVLVGSDASSLQELYRSSLPSLNLELAQWNTIGVPEGASYLIRLEAEDIRGNAGHVDRIVTIDNAAPGAPLNLALSALERDITVTWSPPIDTDVAGYLLYRNDVLVNAPEQLVGGLEPYLIKQTTFIDRARGDGDYVYFVVAMDAASNIGDVSNIEEITLNLRAPHASLYSIENGAVFEDNLYLGAVSEDIDIAHVRFEYRPAGGESWSLVNANAEDRVAPFEASWDTSGLDYATYEIRALATDNGGLTDPDPGVLTVYKHDITKPDSVVITDLSVVGHVVSLQWGTSEDTDLGGYFVYRREIGGASPWVKVFDETVLTTAYDDSGVVDGKYEYAVTVVDAAGNESFESNASRAIVFTPLLTPLFSPTNIPDQILHVITQPNAQVRIELAGVVVASAVSDAEGVLDLPFNLTQIGRANYEVIATSEEGFISSRVLINIVYAPTPSQVQNVAAVDEGTAISLTWDGLTSEDIFGYRVYRDGVSVSPETHIDGITFSTQIDGANEAFLNRMVDGNPGSSWFFDRSNNPQYLDIELPSVERVSSMELHWMWQSSTPYECAIQAWDGEQYVDLIRVPNPEGLTEQLVEFARPYLTNKIRLWFSDIRTSQVGIREMYVTSINLSDSVGFYTEVPPIGFYEYQVSAVNSGGFEGPLSEVASVEFANSTPLIAIGDLSGSVDSSTVTLNWTDVNNSNDVFYRIYRDDYLVGENPVEAEMSFVDLNVLNGSYSYTVRAVNDLGAVSPASNTVNLEVSVSELPSPVSLSATIEGLREEVLLTWEAAPDSDPVAYAVYRSSGNTGEYSFVAEIQESQYLDRGLQIGESYSYYVVALDNVGNASSPSIIVSVLVEDNVPPVQTRIGNPTTSLMALNTTAGKVVVSGVAEPGTLVELENNGVIVEQQYASADAELVFEEPVGSKIIRQSEGGNIAVLYSKNSNSEKFLKIATKDGWETINIGSILGFDPASMVWSGERLFFGGRVYLFSRPKVVELDLETKNINSFKYDLTLPDVMMKMLLAVDIENGMFYFNSEQEPRTIYRWSIADNTVNSFSVNQYLSEGRFSASFDSRYLVALSHSSSNTMVGVVDLANSTSYVIPVPNGSIYSQRYYPQNAQWSKDGKTILFTAQLNSGIESIFTLNVETGSYSALSDFPSDFYLAPTWADNDETIVAGWRPIVGGKAEIVEIHLPTQSKTSILKLPSGDLLETLVVSKYRSLVIGRYDFLGRVNAAGNFAFDQVDLDLGENEFKAHASDELKGISITSSPVIVNRLEQDKADLSVSLDTSHLIPVKGETIIVSARVVNTGLVDSIASTVRVVARGEGGDITALFEVSAPKLAPGAEFTYSANWVSDIEGEYQLVAVVDPSNVVTESNEKNNTSVQSVQVVATSTAFVRLDLVNAVQGSSLGANEDLSVKVSVVNPGLAFNGNLVISIEDENGFLVEEIRKDELENLATGSTLVVNQLWNTGVTYPGLYQVHVSLFDTEGQVVDSAVFLFNISADPQFISSVSVLSPIHGANSSVQITALVANQGGNSLLEAVDVNVSIISSVGDVLHSEDRAFSNILPGATSKLSFVWNTENNLPDNYIVRMVAILESSDIEAQESLSSFQIIQGEPQISGAIIGAPLVYGKSEGIAFDFDVFNHGNSPLSNVELIGQLRNIETGEVLASKSIISDVVYESDEVLSLDFGPTNISIGSYQLVLDASIAALGQTYQVALDRKILIIEDRTGPVLELLSPTSNGIFNSERVVLAIAANDEDSGMDSVSITIDGQESIQLLSSAASGAGIYEYSLSSLNDGAHSVAISAIDKAGNSSAADTVVEFSIDNTPPLIEISSVEEGKVYSQSVSPVVSISDENLELTEILLNGSVYLPGAELANDGDYRLTVLASDSAGNQSSRVVFFAIDTISALISIDGVSNGAAYNEAVTPLITVVDENLEDVVVTLNGIPFVSGTEITASGEYTLTVVATDAAGNESSLTLAFEVDTTPPAPPTIVSPLNNSVSDTDVVPVVGHTEPGATVFGTNTTTGNEYVVMADSNGEFVFNEVTLASDINHLEFYVVDKAGNVGTSSLLTVSLAPEFEVDVSQGIASHPRVLIWATDRDTNNHGLCSNGVHTGHNSWYQHYDIDLEATIELLQQSYAEAGIEYTLVRTPTDFRYAIRTQRYNVINLINLTDAHSQPTHFEGEQGMEMRAAVLSGTGVVLNFTRAYSFYILRDMMAANVEGQTTDNIVSLNGVFGNTAQPWVLSDTGLHVVMEGATGFGNMNYKYYGCSLPTCNQPSIITNKYGLGDTVLLPFNLPDAGNTPEVREMIAKVAEYAAPDNLIAQPDTMYSVDWHVSGLTNIDSLVVDQELPLGFVYRDLSANGSFTGSSGHWNFASLTDDELWLSAIIQTPNQIASDPILTMIYDTIASDSNLAYEDEMILAIDTTLSQLQAGLLDMVNNLPVDGSNSWRKTNILQRINQAFALNRSNKWESEQALLYMLLAIDDLRYLNGSMDALVKASNIIRAYQSRWVYQ